MPTFQFPGFTFNHGDPNAKPRNAMPWQYKKAIHWLNEREFGYYAEVQQQRTSRYLVMWWEIKIPNIGHATLFRFEFPEIKVSDR